MVRNIFEFKNEKIRNLENYVTGNLVMYTGHTVQHEATAMDRAYGWDRGNKEYIQNFW